MTSIVSAHRSVVVGLAAGLPLLACVVLIPFRDSIANTNAALGLVLLIVAAASTGIRSAGLVAAVSSAAWFDFFLTEPYQQFTITDQADIETAILLVLVGIAVTEVALWGHRQHARASQQQGYLDGVHGTAATVGAGRTSTSSYHRSRLRPDPRRTADRQLPVRPGNRHGPGHPRRRRHDHQPATPSTSSGWACPPTPRSRSRCAVAGSRTADSC